MTFKPLQWAIIGMVSCGVSLGCYFVFARFTGKWNAHEPRLAVTWEVCCRQDEQLRALDDRWKRNLSFVESYIGRVQGELESGGPIDTLSALANIERARNYCGGFGASNPTQMQPIGDLFPFDVATHIISIVLSVLAGLHLRTFCGNPMDSSRQCMEWGTPYLVIVLIVWILEGARITWTSVFLVDRTWFQADDFCYSPVLFGLSRVAFLGTCMVIAFPASIFWCLTRPEVLPELDDMTCLELVPELHSQIRFAQSWSIIPVLLFSTPTILWLRLASGAERRSVGWFMMPSLLGLTGICFLLWRLMRNVYRLRQIYHESLSAFLRGGGSRDEASPDPTLSILGDDGWKLPARMAMAFGAVWAVLEATKLDDVLLGATLPG